MTHQPHPLIALIDEAVKLASDNSFRDHLGGSMIGRACDRELWYGFRHATRPDFDGRMLRLFNRGHREEERFVEYLRSVGAIVYEFAQCLLYHPESDCYMAEDWGAAYNEPLDDVTDSAFHRDRAKKLQGIELKQWRILDVDGHFGGSLDAIITNLQGLDSEALGEFKTHNDKSFKKLLEAFALHGHGEGLKHAKVEHWSQMQVYMHKRGIKHGIYIAVNKNDEHLHIEYVAYAGREVGETLLARANRIIHSKTPPRRIGSGRASWFDCKYCTHKGVCHFGEPMLKSCRSCRFVSPGPDGTWHCSKWNSVVPKDFMKKGCDQYLTIHD